MKKFTVLVVPKWFLDFAVVRVKKLKLLAPRGNIHFNFLDKYFSNCDTYNS